MAAAEFVGAAFLHNEKISIPDGVRKVMNVTMAGGDVSPTDLDSLKSSFRESQSPEIDVDCSDNSWWIDDCTGQFPPMTVGVFHQHILPLS